MTDKEALKLALEAQQIIASLCADKVIDSKEENILRAAFQQALAQPAPAQEPVAWEQYAIKFAKGRKLTYGKPENLPSYIGVRALVYANTTPPAAQPALGDIRALKHRIHELEGDVLGYKQMLDLAEEKLKPAPVPWSQALESVWAEPDEATSPAAQRQWVGLDELQKERLVLLICNNQELHELRELVDEIEAQLKELNT